jgi:hypothetical protein
MRWWLGGITECIFSYEIFWFPIVFFRYSQLSLIESDQFTRPALHHFPGFSFQFSLAPSHVSIRNCQPQCSSVVQQWAIECQMRLLAWHSIKYWQPTRNWQRNLPAYLSAETWNKNIQLLLRQSTECLLYVRLCVRVHCWAGGSTEPSSPSSNVPWVIRQSWDVSFPLFILSRVLLCNKFIFQRCSLTSRGIARVMNNHYVW